MSKTPANSDFYVPPPAMLMWAARLLAFAALLISSYLLWVALASEGHVAGCGSDSVLDCDHVLSSRWSHAVGIPVSLPAVVLYALTLLALFAAGAEASEQNQVYAWRLLLALTLIAGLGGLWFIGLQVFVIQSFCPYCLAVHGCGLLLLSFVWAWGPVRFRGSTTRQIDPILVEPATCGAVFVVSLLCVLSLVTAQALVAPAEKAMEIVEVETVTSPSAETSVPSDVSISDNSRPPVDDAAHSDAIAQDDAADATVGPSTDEEPAPPDPSAIDKTQSGETSVGDELNGDVDSAKGSERTDAPARQRIESTRRTEAAFDPELEALLSDAPVPAKKSPQSTANVNDANEDDAWRPAKGKAADDVEPPPATPRRRRISMLDGKLQLDAGQQPVIGDLDASCLVVEMFDYTCPHCRVLHRYMRQAHERYGEQLAVALICVPMNTSCNKYVQSTAAMHINACIYARLALAVWMKAPDKFASFHRYLMDPQTIPTTRDARSEAARLMGDELLDETLADPALDAHLKANTELYKQAGAGVIPKVIYDRIQANGEPASAQRLFDVFEKNIGLAPQASEQ